MWKMLSQILLDPSLWDPADWEANGMHVWACRFPGVSLSLSLSVCLSLSLAWRHNTKLRSGSDLGAICRLAPEAMVTMSSMTGRTAAGSSKFGLSRRYFLFWPESSPISVSCCLLCMTDATKLGDAIANQDMPWTTRTGKMPLNKGRSPGWSHSYLTYCVSEHGPKDLATPATVLSSRTRRSGSEHTCIREREEPG
ncbi:hypothetical protein B0H66DRAFT_366975 [Apodospora peruviana]|uniref:Uncharacterized protein n=1 Tax=Apodospora peruviana TaxID=516989 RepID=A0AAE0LZW0_9PEZI|nr:hypothetical protein B0H66DRAFT_366975 [Apodospora peruviana]